MYSQLTTGKPSLVISKIASEESAVSVNIGIDTQKNKAQKTNQERITWTDDSGEIVEHGVKMIRLWPKWFDQFDEDLVRRVRLAGASLHLNGTLGELKETYALLKHFPVSLSSDDPRKLKRTMRKIKHGVWPGGTPETSPPARVLLTR